MLEVQTKPPTYSWNDINTGVGTQVVTITGPTAGGAGVTTASKITRAIFHGLMINNAGSSWEIDVYDGTSSSATSIAKIRTNGTTTAPIYLPYDITLNSGLFIDTVKGTTVGDLTVLYLAE